MRKPVLPYANNKGKDQPAHPRSLISAFVLRFLYRIIPLVSIFKISRLQLASEAAQPGLSLTWSETPKTGFLVTWLIHERRFRYFEVQSPLRKDSFKIHYLQNISMWGAGYIFADILYALIKRWLG